MEDWRGMSSWVLARDNGKFYVISEVVDGKMVTHTSTTKVKGSISLPISCLIYRDIHEAGPSGESQATLETGSVTASDSNRRIQKRRQEIYAKITEAWTDAWGVQYEKLIEGSN